MTGERKILNFCFNIYFVAMAILGDADKLLVLVSEISEPIKSSEKGHSPISFN